MIVNRIDDTTGLGYVMVCANLSASIRANIGVILFLLLAMLVISLPWIFAGFWLAGIFVVIHGVGLAAALCITVQSCRVRDVIRLEEQQVIVEQGKDCPEHRWVGTREWTKVLYTHSRKRAALPVVRVVTSGEGIRLVARVTYQDIRRLVRVLRRHLTCDEILTDHKARR